MFSYWEDYLNAQTIGKLFELVSSTVFYTHLACCIFVCTTFFKYCRFYPCSVSKTFWILYVFFCYTLFVFHVHHVWLTALCYKISLKTFFKMCCLFSLNIICIQDILLLWPNQPGLLLLEKLILQSWNNPPFDSCEDRTFITHHIRQNLTLY